MAKKGFDYEIYKRWYFKQQAVAHRAGKEMAVPLYSEQEARRTYAYTKEDLDLEVKEGLRKKGANVYQYMVRAQQTEISSSRAKAIYRMVQETGQNISFKDIKYMTNEEIATQVNWDKIKDVKKRLLAMGQDLTWVNSYISYFYFGSE